jgi:hypothetical protein
MIYHVIVCDIACDIVCYIACDIVCDIIEAQALPRQCLQRGGIKIINLQFRDIDNDAGGAGGAGAWPQRQPAAHEASKGENAVKLSHTTSHMISHLGDIACDKIKYPTRHRM